MIKGINFLLNKKIFFFFKIAISIICVIFILKNYDFDLRYLSRINNYQIIISFLFLFINLIFASLRIKEIIGDRKLLFYIKVNWIATFVAIFLPSLAGTELSRGYMLKKKLQQPLSKIITYILADRIIGFITLCFFTFYLIYFYEKNIFFLLIFISIISFILLIIYEDTINQIFIKRFNFSHKIIIYAFISNLAMIFHIYTLMDFNLIRPFTLELISIIALFIILNTVSITPLGFGLTELIFLKLFSDLITENNILEAFVFSRIILLSFAIIAICYFINFKNVSKKRLSNIQNKKS